MQVVSYEKVTVPAGTFAVSKLKRTRDVWGGDMTDRIGSSRGRMSSKGFSVQDGLFYYSEKVGMVKCDEGTEHSELIDDSPNR